jgi:hypothetical protein
VRRAIIALLAVGALLGLGFAARRMSQKMRAHMSEMAAHCKEMMANRNGGGAPSSEVEESRKTEGAAASSTPGA